MSEPKPVTAEDMRRFNALILWSRKKGYAGKEELDHDPKLRQKVFDEFNKENPKDAFPIDRVQDIQREILAYKQKSLANIKDFIKKGFNPLAPGATPENYMSEVSKEDNIFGKYTSNFMFPDEHVKDRLTGESKRLGFAPASKFLAPPTVVPEKTIKDFLKK